MSSDEICLFHPSSGRDLPFGLFAHCLAAPGWQVGLRDLAPAAGKSCSSWDLVEEEEKEEKHGGKGSHIPLLQRTIAVFLSNLLRYTFPARAKLSTCSLMSIGGSELES